MSRPLVLLHGFTGAPSSWDAVVEALPSDRPVLAPALLGHGADTDAATFEGEVDRLADLIRDRLPSPVHLAGYSLGGRVALGLLVRHPSLFRTATLMGASAGLADAGARRDREAWDDAWARRLEEDGLEAFVDRWERVPLFASQATLDAESLARQRAIRLGHDPAGLARSLRVLGLAAMPDYGPALADVTVPVRLVVGARDAKFRAIAEAMATRLPRARVCVVDGAGHNVVLERPQEIVRLLQELE